MSRTLVGAALALAVATPAAGQLCAGAASFGDHAFQLFGGGSLNRDTKSLAEGFGHGGAGIFGQVELGSTKFDNFAGSPFAGSSFGGSSLNVRVAGGYQLSLGRGGQIHLCPTAGAGLGVGPVRLGG